MAPSFIDRGQSDRTFTIPALPEALSGALAGIDGVSVRAICHGTDEVARVVLGGGPDLVLYDVTGDEAFAEVRGVAEAGLRSSILAWFLVA